MKDESSSFYCGKKHCRKTAWDTPEYMTPEDWALAKKVVSILEENKTDAFATAVYGSGHARDFFHRVIGWPEGFIYCMDARYSAITAVPGMIRHELQKLKQAIISHDNQ